MVNNSEIRLIPLDTDNLAPYSEAFTYDGEEYKLKEANAEAVRVYRNATTRELKLTDGKVTGLGNLADAEILLISLCVEKKVNKPGEQGGDVYSSVRADTVKGWPNRLTKKLYARIKDVSDLNELSTPDQVRKQIALLQKQLQGMTGENETGPKGGPPSTTDTSA